MRFWAGRVARVLLAAALATTGLFYLLYALSDPAPALNDFGSFWASGRAALDGLDPYAIYPETFRIPAQDIVHPNLNPPASLLLFAPLSLMEPHVALGLVWWLGLLAYLGVVATAIRRQPDPDAVLPMAAWALALPALWDGLRLGQIYVFLLVLVALAWHFLEHRRDWAAGLAVGLFVALKPNFLFWPALLFIAGYRRAAIWAGGGFLVAGLLPVLFFGPAVYGQWYAVAVAEAGSRHELFSNASVMSIGYRMGSVLVASVLAVAVLAWVGLRLWRGQADITHINIAGIGLGVALSPIAWFHYIAFLLPAMLSRRWSPRIVAAAVLMLVPLGPLHSFYMHLLADYPAWALPIHASIGSVFSWTILLLLAGLLTRRR